MSGAGWIASAYISDLWGLYAAYGLLCGVGTGIVYIGVIGLMVRWFPERRGFATGVVAAGYGFGAILTTFRIDELLKETGYQHTLIVFGSIFAAIGVVCALMLRTPRTGEVAARSTLEGAVGNRDYSPAEMLRTPVFWLMFVMMSMMSTGGLMVVTQFTNFAKSSASTQRRPSF